MALYDTTWYLSSVDYAAIPQFQINHAYNAADIIRQLTASTGNERVFICIVAGTSAGAEPSWTLTRGAKTTSNTAQFQECTGQPGINGDFTNCPTWDTYRAFTSSATLGQIIRRNNNNSLQICTTAGTMSGVGAEPGFSDTAGTTTTDNAAVWTSLGALSNYTGWQAAAGRLSNLLASGFAAGPDNIYAANTHAETQATSLTLYGTTNYTTGRVHIFSVDRGHLPPTAAGDLVAGASISTTGATAMSIGNGFAYVNGVAFNCGTGGSFAGLTIGNNPNTTATDNWWEFENCTLAIGTSAGNDKIILGGSSTGPTAAWNCRVTLRNTKLGFGSTTQGLEPREADFEWLDTPVAWSNNTPSTLFVGATGRSTARIEGVNLDSVNSVNNGSSGLLDILLKDCNAPQSIVTPASPVNERMVWSRADADINGGRTYLTRQELYMGFQDMETSILRSPSAGDGSNSYSWYVDVNTKCNWLLPYRSLPLAAWNSVVGGVVTATIYCVWSLGTPPYDDDVWIEVRYLGTAASTLSSKAHSTKDANWESGVQLPADSSVWQNASGWTPFKLTVDFTPQQAGWVYAQAVVGCATTTPLVSPFGTLYVDPTLYLT